MKEMSPAIEIITHDSDNNLFTAESFIDYLRPSHNHWHKELPLEPKGSISGYPMYVAKSEWVFRGQWNFNWTLLSKARREEFERYVLKELKRGKENGLTDSMISKGNFWINTEALLLREFVEALAEFGYPISSKRDHDFYSDSPYTFDNQNNDSEYLDIMGLAQHHGIPTRFLDWTYNPLHAAYFATANEFRTGETDAICVWCLNITSPLIGNESIQRKHGMDRSKSKVKIHKLAKHKNRFLQAQYGVFTENIIDNKSNYYDEHNQWKSTEEIIVSEYENLQDGLKNIATPTLRKIILEKNEINHLLLLLQREGYKKSILMPTLDNVVYDVMSKWDT